MSEHDSKNQQVHPDREQLFGNEAFAIGMLQVISGGSLVAALSQIETILEYGSKLWFLIFMTLMSFGLLASVLSAYWRHQYKMWDVKRDAIKANWYLPAMRRSMLAAVIFVVLGVLILVSSFWFAEYCVA